MAKSKLVIKTLDQKPKKNLEGQANVLTLANINKSLWAKKFERLCDHNNLKVLTGKRK
jgi:hypothetical protein